METFYNTTVLLVWGSLHDLRVNSDDNEAVEIVSESYVNNVSYTYRLHGLWYG